MEKADAMKWVKALRSGEYKQGTKLLKFNGKYCCLGVACEIMPDKFIPIQEGPDAAVLSARESVLKDSVGTIQSLDVSLIRLNDGSPEYGIERLNFDEIADIIQIFYEEL